MCYTGVKKAKHKRKSSISKLFRPRSKRRVEWCPIFMNYKKKAISHQRMKEEQVFCLKWSVVFVVVVVFFLNINVWMRDSLFANLPPSLQHSPTLTNADLDMEKVLILTTPPARPPFTLTHTHADTHWAARLQTLTLPLCTVGGSLGLLQDRAAAWKSNLPQQGQLISLLIL